MNILIVDKEDKVIGVKEREKLDDEKDIYRVSALWILNSNGENLLSRRAFTKLHAGGKWGPAVAGTVEEGETYYSNIVKEADEELGIKNIKPKKMFKELVNGKHKHFTQWFFMTLDKDLSEFKIKTDEVEEVKWVKFSEVLKLVKNNLTITLNNALLNEIKKMK